MWRVISFIQSYITHTMPPFFFDKQAMFLSLFVWSFNVMFVSFHTYTFKRTSADILFFFSFFFSIDSVGYRYFYRFQTLIFFLFFVVHFNVSLILSLSFFSSPPHIFPPFIQCVCACVFKTMIFFFFRDRLFRKRRSRKRMSSLYLLRRVQASFKMFGCWITQKWMNEKRKLGTFFFNNSNTTKHFKKSFVFIQINNEWKLYFYLSLGQKEIYWLWRLKRLFEQFSILIWHIIIK